MREKLRTVEIHYTLEPAVHGNLVQYGEAGVYWGEEQIRASFQLLAGYDSQTGHFT